MRASNKALAFRPNDKNRLYLEMLGFLDGRTGIKKKDAANLSRFINECLTRAMEGGFHGKKDLVTSDQLLLAFYEHKAISKAREWEAKGMEWDEYKKRLACQAAKTMEAQQVLV